MIVRERALPWYKGIERAKTYYHSVLSYGFPNCTQNDVTAKNFSVTVGLKKPNFILLNNYSTPESRWDPVCLIPENRTYLIIIQIVNGILGKYARNSGHQI